MPQARDVVEVGATSDRILLIRGERVIVDADLAEFYGVTTTRLNEQVKRNRARFPEDVMVELTASERAELVAKCDHPRLISARTAGAQERRQSEEGIRLQQGEAGGGDSTARKDPHHDLPGHPSPRRVPGTCRRRPTVRAIMSPWLAARAPRQATHPEPREIDAHTSAV
jgi:hypothetical protein